ncbi:hypothetical protein BH09VER1_BH09VER1_47630 [soil metagenome]
MEPNASHIKVQRHRIPLDSIGSGMFVMSELPPNEGWSDADSPPSLQGYTLVPFEWLKSFVFTTPYIDALAVVSNPEGPLICAVPTNQHLPYCRSAAKFEIEQKCHNQLPAFFDRGYFEYSHRNRRLYVSLRNDNFESWLVLGYLLTSNDPSISLAERLAKICPEGYQPEMGWFVPTTTLEGTRAWGIRALCAECAMSAGLLLTDFYIEDPGLATKVWSLFGVCLPGTRITAGRPSPHCQELYDGAMLPDIDNVFRVLSGWLFFDDVAMYFQSDLCELTSECDGLAITRGQKIKATLVSPAQFFEMAAHEDRQHLKAQVWVVGGVTIDWSGKADSGGAIDLTEGHAVGNSHALPPYIDDQGIPF